jgi:hypothetical protein
VPGLDFSPLTNPQHGNMLQMLQGAEALQAAQLQNAALAQQVRARQALGPILQGAIDPKTGSLDYNKAFVGMSQNPDTAWMAPDFLDKAIARQGTQADIAMKHFDLAQKQQGMIAQKVAGLLGSDAPVTGQSLRQAATDLHAANPELFPLDQVIAFQQKVMGTPEGAPMLALAKQIALSSAGTLDTMKSVYPALQARVVGGQTVLTQEPQFGGTPRVAGVLPHTVNPESLLVDVDGSVTGMPGAKYYAGNSGASAISNGAGGAVAPGATQSPGAGTGIPPSSSPRVPIAQVPESVKKGWDALSDAFKERLKETIADQQLDMALSKMRSLVESGRFNPGAGQDVRRALAATASALGFPKETVDALNNTSLSANQVFNSIALDLAAKMMARNLAGGGRFTNIEFNTALQSKPSENMTKEAVLELIDHFQQGISLDRKMTEAYTRYQDQGKTASQFLHDWNASQQLLHDRMKKHYEKLGAK